MHFLSCKKCTEIGWEGNLIICFSKIENCLYFIDTFKQKTYNTTAFLKKSYCSEILQLQLEI